MSLLREHLTQLRAFLRSDFRRVVLWCFVGMFACIALGVLVGTISPEAVEDTVNTLMEAIEEAGVIDEEGNISVFAILNNNWQAMLTTVLYGFVPFVFFPAISLLSNSFMVGVLGTWYVSNQLPLSAYLAGLIPHGIFELSALVLSVAAGLWLCRTCNRFLIRKDKADASSLLETAADVLRILVLLVAPLVVIAAFVECYITPLIMGFFL